ncbi:hypothetical protein K8F61_05150 [Microbacterium resistens]|uniref:Phage tail protein n=1 Tax=Microbacterium resistens TaxID=156977 RepID=A0ABY3RYH7_9MICO|nr:hypothetical protein [Microbacterium resistens]UGS27577.1 hypothetical protein K8F61_05150 [Microbacterium resistens]
MASQVAVAEVAVVPTFQGFRKKTNAEAEGAATSAGQGFRRIFSKTGSDSGKAAGQGFKAAFEGSAKGASDKVTKQLEADVAKASRALSTARLKEQDAIGKVRVAQAQLNEANKKYAQDSSQVIRAQERLAKASRDLERDHKQTESATDDLKRAQGELARAADRAGDELTEAGSKGVNGFRSSVIGGVKSFAGPLIAAFAALGIGSIAADAFREAKDFVLGTIDIASDLNESVNAVEVSYGDAADAVLKLGENSAKAFGLSKNDLNGYATQFSAFVKTIAGSGGDVVGTLEDLIGRGTDFASVFNLDVSDALGLFQSGLAGETEPLRKYGIDLSAAAVEAYALANGIGDGTGELTEAEKVQARYGKLLEATSDVAGDFANTQDELANKNRVNAASWEDIQAKIGDGFLPVAEQLAGIVGDDLLPVIGQLAEEQGPALAQAFADVLPDLTEIAKDLLPLLPDLLESFADALPAVLDLVGAIAPLVAWWAQGSLDATNMLGALFDLISGDASLEEFKDRLLNLSGPLGDVIAWGGELLSGFLDWFGQIPAIVGAGVDGAIAWLQGLPQRAVDAVGDLSGWLVDSGRSLMQGFLDGIEEMLGPIGDAVSGALDWLTGFFPHSPAKRGPLAGSGWTALRRSGQATWDQFVSGFDDGGDPPFPGFPGNGAGPGPDVSGGSGSVPAAGARITQNNHFAHMPPEEAVEATGQRLSSLARRARV